jgi:hypothetical protein
MEARMGFNEAEKNELKLMLGEVFDDKIAPYCRKVDVHEITLYGEKGNNGMKGDIISIKKRLNMVERVSYIGQGALLVLVKFSKQIFGG